MCSLAFRIFLQTVGGFAPLPCMDPLQPPSASSEAVSVKEGNRGFWVRTDNLFASLGAGLFEQASIF